MDETKILQAIADVQKSVNELSQDLNSFKQETRSEFGEVKESLEELKASAIATDKILEQHPVARIERIEDHLHLPRFSPAYSEE